MTKGLLQGLKWENFSKGFGENVVARHCPGCEATLVNARPLTLKVCPFCHGEALQEQALADPPVTPFSILPFTIPYSTAKSKLRRHLRRRYPWMLPKALLEVTRPERLLPVYLPYYLADVYLRGSWKAKVGFEVPFQQGGKMEKKEVWDQTTGYWEHLFEQVPVLVSSQVPGALVEQTGGFSFDELVDFQSGHLAAFPAEVTDVGPKEGIAAIEAAIDEAFQAAAIRNIRGDKIQDLALTAEKEGLTFQQVLVPVWHADVTYYGRRFQYLVNGRSGRVAGDKPVSRLRIAILAGLLLLLIGVMLWWVS